MEVPLSLTIILGFPADWAAKQLKIPGLVGIVGIAYMNDKQATVNKPESKSTERKLNQYYSRRRYLIAP